MTAQPTEPTAERPRKKRRVFMWVFLAIQALFIIWLITGIASVSDSAGKDCGTLDPEACTAATQIGGGIGFLLIIGLWVMVDFILGVGYLIVRASSRR